MQSADKAKLMMAMKQFIESPIFNPYFKPKEYIDELVGTLGQYKAPYVKTSDELAQSQTGQQIAEALGKVAAEGGPEVQAAINQFLQSLGIQPPQGGMAPEITGGNGGGGPAMPASEPSPPVGG
jgi:hypothetical protein